MIGPALVPVFAFEAKPRFWLDCRPEEASRMTNWVQAQPAAVGEVVRLVLELVDDEPHLPRLQWHLREAETRAGIVGAALRQGDLARARRAALALVEELDRAAARYRDADVEATA